MSRVLKTGEDQITQSYAKHCELVKQCKAWAQGTDIVKKPSQTEWVTAHSDGIVIKTMKGVANGQSDGEGMGYGNYVMIDHGMDSSKRHIVTLYAHLESVAVQSNQAVSKGYSIGRMGNTGRSFGAHLHFEVRRYKNLDMKRLHDTNTFEWLNPETYLDTDLFPKTYARVQVGSYVVKANAVRQAKKLKAQGFDAIIKKCGANYRVQVGAYEELANAYKMQSKLKIYGYNGYVTTENGEDVPF